MSSSGRHILTWKSVPAFTSVYMHTYTTDGETYIHVERQTDRQTQQDIESERHTQKESVYFPQYSHKLCQYCLNSLYCFVLMNASYSLCYVLYPAL